VSEERGVVRVVQIPGGGETDRSDQGMLGELDRLHQSEDSEVIEPVGLLVEGVEVIPTDEHGKLGPVPPGDRVLSQDDGNIQAFISRLDTVSGSEDVSVAHQSSSTLKTFLTNRDLKASYPGELIPTGLAGDQAGLAGLPLTTVTVQETPELGGRRTYSQTQGRDLQEENNI